MCSSCNSSGTGNAAASSEADVDDNQDVHGGASAATSAQEPLTLSKLPAKVRQGLLEASTRFYSKIPHSFGNKTPPVLLSREQLKEKIQIFNTPFGIFEYEKRYEKSADQQKHGEGGLLFFVYQHSKCPAHKAYTYE